MSDKLRAQVGQDSHVEVELIDDQNNSERMEFDLVAENAADFASGRIGVNTPLGKAIRGKFVGNVVDYVKGDIRKVRILQATPLQAKVPEDANARRQAILDEARRKAERTNTEMFASSYSGKWGDYNTDGVSKTDETDEVDEA
jgi:hypothetical protein